MKRSLIALSLIFAAATAFGDKAEDIPKARVATVNVKSANIINYKPGDKAEDIPKARVTTVNVKSANIINYKPLDQKKLANELHQIDAQINARNAAARDAAKIEAERVPSSRRYSSLERIGGG